MKNEAHLKLKAWIPTPRVVGIVCGLATMKQCHIVNASIGRSTAFLVHGPNNIFDEEPLKLPDRPKSRRTWNTKYKEALTQVTTLTHIVDSTGSLKDVYTLPHDCINILSNAAQKEEGLVLETPRNKGTSQSSTSKSGSSKSTMSEKFTDVCMTGGIPSHANVCIFFQFSTDIFSADITPEMLKLGRVTKVKVFFLVL